MTELTLQGWLRQAEAYVAEGKPLHAVQLYRRLLNEVPTFTEAAFELSYLYLEAGQADAAESVLLRTLDAAPAERTEVIFMLGNLYLRTARYPQALERYGELSELDLPQVHFNSALAHFYGGDMARAEAGFRRTLAADPTFPRINESLGELLIKRKAYVEAVSSLEKAVELDPYAWINHYLLGVALYGNRQHREAYDSLVQALDLDPSEPNGWLMCGEVLIAMNRLDEAEQYLKKAVELNDRMAAAWANLALAALKRDRFQEAGAHLERAVALDPACAQALDARARLTAARALRSPAHGG